MKHLPSIAVILSLILIVSAAPTLASAQAGGNPNPQVLPPNATAFGKTYGAWSAAWWQYVFSQPASTNPLTDLTGAGCTAGQAGPVFFLVGTAGSGVATRDRCVAPTGKALFFPLLNAFDVHTPGDGLDTPQLVWDDLHTTIGFGPFSELHASIDGLPVNDLSPATTRYRACAGPIAGCAPSFSLTFPADNFFSLAAGTYAPAVADGFYLLLAPLAPGTHTVHFGGKGLFGGSEFSQDITYHLTVR